MRYLVEEFADEEKLHYALFSRLAEYPLVENEVKQEVLVPLEDHRFSDYIQRPDLGDKPDEQIILQYALGREDSAMKQYRELAACTEPGPIHDLFEYLANEEIRHKLELEKLYYQNVYNAGPGN